ncbi:MAG: hypothetical protein HQ517_16735 [SAR324 cluster bacterium]|nr:hypothetical protein [SAR324 cluster bacterium]
MRTASNLIIPRYESWDPRNNLPAITSDVNTERDFTIAFARAYLAQIHSIHRGNKQTEICFSREIPINGFGIADFVAVFADPESRKYNKNIESCAEVIKDKMPIVRSFEMKINNWRKALLQAHRYKYFSDVSIVVVPLKKLLTIKNYVKTFKAVNVGIWGFSEETNQIERLYTPRPTKPLKPIYKSRAIQLVSKSSKFLRFS